jgi:hypothetical protein
MGGNGADRVVRRIGVGSATARLLTAALAAAALAGVTPARAEGGTCPSSIRSGCRDAGKTILLLKNDSSNDVRDKLIFKWVKGEMTDINDFGAPTGTTAYALCVYAGTSSAAIVDADIAPNAVFWTMTIAGFKYKDLNGTSDGVQKIILKSGGAGRAKALLKGKGINLPDPPAGPFTTPVTAQLVNSSNNVCYEGVYSGAGIIKNSAEQFKGHSQGP